MTETANPSSSGSILRLPPFTFINGPFGVGKTTLANLLIAQDPSAVRVSFAEPIRMALYATFYPDNPLDPPDLMDGAVKASPIPGTAVTHREWMIRYSSFMKETFNKHIFGELARRTCERLEEYYCRFVFDDCRYIDELSPISLAYGKEACLLIHLERTGHSWADEKFDSAKTHVPSDYLNYPGASHIILSNNGPLSDLLPRLATLLSPRAPGLARR